MQRKNDSERGNGLKVWTDWRVCVPVHVHVRIRYLSARAFVRVCGHFQESNPKPYTLKAPGIWLCWVLVRR